MPRDSIALIGFMATGKTTIGAALVNYLGEDYKFIETDQLIIQKTDKTIPQIFDEEGESKFREYESSVCEQISEFNKVVISCGGGVVLNKANVEHLKKHCHIILLIASLEEIFKRSKKNGIELRPIINNEDPKKDIEKILNFRRHYYEEVAEIVIDTTNKKVQQIVREIVIKTHLKT